MAQSVGTLRAEMEAGQARFGRDMGKARAHAKQFNDGTTKGFKNTNRASAEMTRALKTTAKTMLFIAGPAVIGAFVKASIGAAGNAAEAWSKFDAVFKDQAAATKQWALQFASDVGRSKTSIVTWLATLQDTFVPMGLAREDAASLSKEMVQLAVDLGSFNNIPTQEVVEALQSALVGNTETVRKFGIVINETNTKQEAYTLGLAETGEKLTEQAKIQARVSLIMKGSTDAQGDAIRTADSFNNKQERMKSAWEDLAIAIGNKFLPVAGDAIDVLTDITQATTDFILATDELSDKEEVVVTRVNAAEGAIKRLSGRIKELQERNVVLNKEIDGFNERTEKGEKLSSRGTKALADFTKEVDNNNTAIARGEKKLEQTQKRLARVHREQGKVVKSTIAVTEAEEDLDEVQDALIIGERNLGSVMGDVAEEADELALAMEEIKKVMDADPFAVNLDDLRIGIQEISEVASVVADITEELAGQALKNSELREQREVRAAERRRTDREKEVIDNATAQAAIAKDTIKNSDLLSAALLEIETKKDNALLQSKVTFENESTRAIQNATDRENAIRRKQKPFLIAESIANTAVAITKALPNVPLAILVGILGAIQTANIASQKFATGGSGIIPGTGGTDSQFVGIMATPGERLTIQTPAQQAAGIFPGSSSGRMVVDMRETNALLRNILKKVEGGTVVEVHPLVEATVREVVAPILERDSALRVNNLVTVDLLGRFIGF